MRAMMRIGGCAAGMLAAVAVAPGAAMAAGGQETDAILGASTFDRTVGIELYGYVKRSDTVRITVRANDVLVRTNRPLKLRARTARIRSCVRTSSRAARCKAPAGRRIALTGYLFAGNDKVTVSGSRAGKRRAVTIDFDGYGGNDTFTMNMPVLRNALLPCLQGGSGNDRLLLKKGTKLSAPCMLLGEDGDDVLEGAGGDGGKGNDRLTGGAIADGLDGGSGNDVLSGRGGDDALTGGAGTDRFDGGPGDDLFDTADVRDDDGGGSEATRRALFAAEGRAAPEAVACGPGTDTVEPVDRADVLDGCESALITPGHSVPAGATVGADAVTTSSRCQAFALSMCQVIVSVRQAGTGAVLAQASAPLSSEPSPVVLPLTAAGRAAFAAGAVVASIDHETPETTEEAGAYGGYSLRLSR